MNDQVKHDTVVNLMEILELTDNVIAATHAIQQLPGESLTEEIWEDIQSSQNAVRTMAEIFRSGILQGAKIVDNDALMSHLNTVIEAD